MMALVLVWEPRNGQCIVVLAGHRGWVRCLCTHLDPHHGAAYGGFPRIASGSFDKTVKIWDPLVGGAPIYTIDLPAMATGLLIRGMSTTSKLIYVWRRAAARKARRRCGYGPCPRKRSSARRSPTNRLRKTRRRC